VNKCRITWLVAPAIAAIAACSGSPGTPQGSVIGTGGQGNPPPQYVTINARIVIDDWNKAEEPGRFHGNYLSPATKSIVISLASAGGVPVPGIDASTINTYPDAPSCHLGGNTLACGGGVQAVQGKDVFNVTSFSGPNGTGSLLASGTATANVGGSSGVVSITNATFGVQGVISSLKLATAPQMVDRGKASSVDIKLTAYDSAKKPIAGNSSYESPVTMTIEGDANGSFSFKGTGTPVTSIQVTGPSQKVKLFYDGNTEASSVTLQATVSQPNSASATATLTVSGTPPPPPAGTLYVLNAGSNGGLGGTVTEYAGDATGNVAPKATIALSSKLYARSIAVDATGNLYVGFFGSLDGVNTSNGTPYEGNLVEVFAPGATGNATPAQTIVADKTTGTTLYPQTMAIDSAGDLVTYGATSVDGNAGDAVLIYAPGAAGAAAPSKAWSFTLPQLRYGGPTGIALDTSGNFYLEGALHTALGPDYGVFTNTASNDTNPSATPARTIPWGVAGDQTDIIAGLTSNVAIDGTGAIDVANIDASGNPLVCQGQANVFASGATGGVTNHPPLRIVVFAGVSTSNPNCYNPNYVLTGYYPSIAAFAETLYVAADFNNSVGSFSSLTNGTVQPLTSISGSATGLSSPIGVAVSSLSAREASRSERSHSSPLVH
jgi:hypothetical protein